ncbi:hypothetical protein HID58_079395 [Brassica napus]|uniref:6-phosphogluconate dehydrogenase NADP-binding domain-containing protein n=1 Tax=Brassica napus TaxID=3708 RepID=A0ABQ7Y379_BRANA|nr:hypothetical protein HID58_079395 [Brassica napus]
MVSATLSRISLAGIAAMGQNLALNIAEKGFLISVYNRTTSKVVEILERATVEGNLPVSEFISRGRAEDASITDKYRAVTSTYYRGAVGGMLVIILIGNKCAFMKGRGVGASGVGRTRFLLLQHRKATAKGAGKTLATLQKKKKMEMISRRVLNETDFSCSDGIAQNKARSDCFVCYIFFLLLV